MRLSLAFAFLALGASPGWATVHYAVDLRAPEHHLAQVSADFPQTAAPYLDVKMPAWRTGRYQILNLANGVRGFSAASADGRPLRWEKIDKSTWRVHLQRPTAVRIGYELYGNELGFRTRHIDDSHAYLNASAVFMYADRYRAQDVTVSLNLPPRWRSVSGMRSPGPHRFVAPNWDTLTDSPIEAGVHQTRRFTDGGRDYEVAFWGDGNYDPDAIAGDLQKIVRQASTIWSSYPFQRYLFIIHATDGVGGATEHVNSTVIQIPRYAFRPRERYLSFLSTASHEFVHTWNVKAYRPRGLVPYEFQQENYSDLLWIAEGSTDYFADQLLLRGGIMRPDDYFAVLGDAIDHAQRTPGTLVQSVADASFNEWISVGGDRAVNASANIYSEGLMVSWMLDIALLERTGGRVSYRDVHNLLHRRFRTEAGQGYASADVKAILRELTGQSWDDWWARNVDAPARPDFAAMLAPVGLQLSQRDGSVRPWAGWTGQDFEGATRLSAVERGSPAWNAGFTPGDIIIAFDGKRASKDRFDAALAERRPGDKVTVTLFRRDQLEVKTLVLGGLPSGKPKVVAEPRPTAAQKTLFERWLLVPHPNG